MPTAVTRVMSSVTQPILVDRIVYATITIMSVLIIYDGWQNLRLVDVIGVIVGPVVAMFLAHVFSASLAEQVDLGRALTWNDRLTIVKSESRFLLLCVPPVAIVLVLFAFGSSLNDAIRVALWLEGLSLGYWGYLAARRAGVGGWRVMTYIAADSFSESSSCCFRSRSSPERRSLGAWHSHELHLRRVSNAADILQQIGCHLPRFDHARPRTIVVMLDTADEDPKERE